MNKFAWLLITPLWASPLYAADLMQVYRDAQTNDPAFAAARATLDAGREKMPQGRAGLLPTLTLTGNSVWNENEISTRNGPVIAKPNFNSNGYQLALHGASLCGAGFDSPSKVSACMWRIQSQNRRSWSFR